MKSAYTANELTEFLGTTKRNIQIRARKESWAFKEENGNGGKTKHYLLSSLPADIQKKIAEKETPTSTEVLPFLAPEAALIALKKLTDFPDTSFSSHTTLATIDQNPVQKPQTLKEKWADPETVISHADLTKAGPWVRIIQEAQNVPRGYKKRAWIEVVALRHNCDWRTIYKKVKLYEKKGIIGLAHHKSNKGKPRAWTPDALDFWVGLNLKRHHRKIAADELYNYLNIEARKRSWQVGSYESALWWLKKRLSPQLVALQKGGMRALDNSLPPVLRDYSDLEPFEILVGDQHRFDFWVVDEETGEVFRPECYLWQDLRTRMLYGCAIDKKYDAQLMGLALRIGLRIFGAFKNIYTDNGKPENSRYIIGILKDMRGLGLNREQEISYPLDCTETDPDDISPAIIIPGEHRRAIVRNAKAKMIEGTFRFLEGILRDHFFLPGYVKRLNASAEEQEIDQKETEKLAAKGKLTTYREFVLTVYRALDYYNKQKPHRGVLREWAWKPKPKEATPMQCLIACFHDGWKPTRISEAASDLVFLAKATRIIYRGRIQLQGGRYESDELIQFDGEKVDLRYDPIDPSELLVFFRGEYTCSAVPVEYSSMTDHELANRKIIEKALRRKKFSEEYRRLTSGIPDLREYSAVSPLDKAAALIGKEKEKKLAEQKEFYRTRTAEELDAEVEKLESAEKLSTLPRQKPLPDRPAYFLKEYDRYAWITHYELSGGEPSAEDIEFKTGYESRMDIGQKEYWEAVREVGL